LLTNIVPYVNNPLSTYVHKILSVRVGGVKFDVFIPPPVPYSLILMAGPVYLKCSCGKSNPVHDVAPDKEYTCIFCGQLFKAPVKTEETVTKKKPKGKKGRIEKQKAPLNRNQNKPLL